ncbi:MAG TPA: transcription antitermination factor NusB [Mariprofundaceae bacterium]|nr:transcription antitermination factor NusB [Mariprofundaceae bacterium]
MANRHKSRESALEILYAWSSAEQDALMIPGLLADRIQLPQRKGQDEAYLRELVTGVTEQCEALDEEIAMAVRGRSLASVAHIEMNVLRIAVWELRNRLEIPYRVVINEALQLTRTYADESARGFINGVLDRLARTLRQQEVPAGR